MIKISLYWSHICILHRQEKIFLKKAADRLLKEGIELDVRCFGLGYPEHMCEYLAVPDAKLPDMIISADLEVFEDNRIFGKIAPYLYDVSDWIPLRNLSSLKAVQRSRTLLPVAAIPLVYYTRDPGACEGTRLKDWKGLNIGGINNSAAKTVVKTVWEKYGREAAKDFLKNSHVSDMPIGAFQAVREGKAVTALVPSIYALRADERETFLMIPDGGPLLVPSYFCALKSKGEEVLKKVIREILNEKFCDFYAMNGDLFVYPAMTGNNSRQEGTVFSCPSAAWLSALPAEDFYSLYLGALPTAADPFSKPAGFLRRNLKRNS